MCGAVVRRSTFRNTTRNSATNVRFGKTYVKPKENDMWAGVTSDEAFLVAVKTASTNPIILITVMGVITAIVPGLNEEPHDKSAKVGDGHDCIPHY